jgi:hypothetical protein
MPPLYGSTPYVGIVIGSGYGASDVIEDGFVGVGYSLGSYSGGGQVFPLEFDAHDSLPFSMQFMADRGFGGDGAVSALIGSRSPSVSVVNYQGDHPTYNAFGVLVRGSFLDEVTDLTIILDDLRYTTATPEPTSLALALIVATGFAIVVRIRRKLGAVIFIRAE